MKWGGVQEQESTEMADWENVSCREMAPEITYANDKRAVVALLKAEDGLFSTYSQHISSGRETHRVMTSALICNHMLSVQPTKGKSSLFCLH